MNVIDTSKNRVLNKKTEQSTLIVEARYSLSRDEQRVLLLASQNPLGSDGWFSIRICDYALAFNLSTHEASRDLREAYNNLWSRSLTVYTESEECDEFEFRWIEARQRSKTLGKYGFQFTTKLLPYIKDLSERVSFPLNDIAQLVNPLHIRLYSWFHAAVVDGELTLTIDYIKERLNLTSMSAYNRYDNLRRRVIDTAIEKINDTSPLSVAYEPIKEGRKVVALSFTIALKS